MNYPHVTHHGPVDRPVDLVVEEGGPGVGLDQVDPEVAVQHEVVAEQLVGVVGGLAAALEAELLGPISQNSHYDTDVISF